MKIFKTLYKRATTGKIQQWTMIVDGGSFYTESGQVDGKITKTKPTFCEAKNVGKKNETTAEQQAISEAQSKWDHKLAHGYSESPDDVDSTGYEEPMLAKQFDDYKDDVKPPFYVDDKLNGMRANAKKNSFKSRKNKDIHTVPHIVNTLAPLFEKYPNLFLDGEMFNEALKNNLNRLIKLTSVAIKPKDITKELLKESEQIVRYYVYDGFGFEGITQDTPFIKRRAALKKLLKDIKYIKVLDYTVCHTIEEVKGLLAKAKKAKSEGIIVRWGDCHYEFKRSKYLLKDKNFIDSEFVIEDIQEGTGDWTGCAKRIVLQLPKSVKDKDGKIVTNFASNIEGDRAYLSKLLQEKELAIGQLATVTFQEYSEYGIPLIPYVIAIRNYE